MSPAVETVETQLEVSVHGSISLGLRNEVVSSVGNCYARMGVPLPPAVALRFFDTTERLLAEQEREQRALGVVSGGIDPLPVGHSGWGDMPRVTICAELLQPQSELLRRGMVHVAAAHAVLHGSTDYYLFHIPAEIVRQAQADAIDSALLQQLLYHVATAVKGHAAVRLLVSHGFIADQIALALHQLELTPEDLLAWRLAATSRQARSLYLMAQLRPLLAAHPLLPHAPSLTGLMRQLMAHLPAMDRDGLLKLSASIGAMLGDDTRSDIQRAFSQAWEYLVRR